VASLPVLLKRARHLLSAALFILMVVSAYGAFVGISVIDALPSEGMNTYRGHAYRARSHAVTAFPLSSSIATLVDFYTSLEDT